jgi:hypothetical protein
MGPPLPLSDEDLDRLAAITDADIEPALALWDSAVRGGARRRRNAVGYAGEKRPTASAQQTITVNLGPGRDEATATGTATITDMGGTTRVVINVTP